MKIWFQNRRMKWRNCKEKEVHNTRSPMDELMAQGLAQEVEEPSHHHADAKTKRSPPPQKNIRDSWEAVISDKQLMTFLNSHKTYGGDTCGRKMPSLRTNTGNVNVFKACRLLCCVINVIRFNCPVSHVISISLAWVSNLLVHWLRRLSLIVIDTL